MAGFYIPVICKVDILKAGKYRDDLIQVRDGRIITVI
mgnify:CR=1 FL=1